MTTHALQNYYGMYILQICDNNTAIGIPGT